MSQWTPEQEAAILARGASVVVSAAAGSGKTSVLVERLIRLLEEPAYPAEKMVVVTFTNDAAGEVRTRLNRALSKKILADPENTWLRQQQIMLQSASISTIHSFCLQLLRAHFAQLDLSANFRIMEQSEADELRAQAAADVMEALSVRAAADETAASQQKLLFDAFCGHDDAPLERLLISLHGLTELEPFGEAMLAESARKYALPDALCRDALAMIRESIEEVLSCYPPAIALAEQMNSEKSVALLRTEQQNILAVADALATENCAEIGKMLKPNLFGTLNTLPRKKGEFESEKMTVRALRNYAKALYEKIAKTWAIPLQFAEQDISRHAELLLLLSELVRELDERYTERKRERNGVTFNDAMRLALSLLAERLPDGTICKTPLAEQLSEQYVCIMIDEFQDADNTQDLIFRMLSRGGSAERYGSNLFVVGDSKQCIYRFRNANPENFYRAMREGAPYVAPMLTENTCIHLNMNFRSAEEVVTVINHVFSQMMSEQVGEIGYDDTQALVRGAKYFAHRRSTEIMLLPQTGEETRTEPDAIAARIAWHLAHQTLVQGKDGEPRPCEPRDFLILMRYKTRMPAYAAALEKAGIPVTGAEHEDYLQSPEILLLIDLLRAIDNPLPEVPIASAMLSPMFGFTVDELIQVRLYAPKLQLFQAMLRIRADEEMTENAPELTEKCRVLTEFLDAMRNFSAMDTPEQLIRRIYRQTDFLGMMQMSAGGAQKKANLRALTAYARTFEENRGGGLSAFLRYLDAIRDRGEDLTAGSVPAGTENVVQIKSVHASKGLEAPFVILADADHGFSNKDASEIVQYHSKLGVGFQLHDPETISKGKSLPWTLIYQKNRTEMVSEEMRLLYVALTRAREYLILPLAYTDSRCANVIAPEAYLQASGDGISASRVGRVGCFADWLFMALIRNTSCEQMRRELAIDCGAAELPPLPVAVWTVTPEAAETAAQELQDTEPILPDFKLTETLAAQCAWEYDGRLAALTAKYGVSELAKKEDFDAPLQKPQFRSSGSKMTGSERGTAVHTFMQYADFEAAASDLSAEIERCRALGRLSARQAAAVMESKIADFFQSELYQRIRNALHIWREQKFMVRICDLQLDGPLAQIGADYAETDGMVTGIMDLVFEEQDGIVLVDYKTDTGKNEAALLEAYTEQIRLYAEALSLLMKKPVRGCWLYAVALCKSIPVTL